MIVPGDAEGCTALGTALRRAAVGTGRTRGALDEARAATADWEGVGAGVWEDVVSRQRAAADDLADGLQAAGSALTAFGDALAAAQRLAARARSLAASACLTLAADGWVPPVDVPVGGPHATPEAAAAAAAASRLAAVRSEVLALCGAAREAERAAHAALLGALRGVDAPSPAPRPRGGLTREGPVLTWPGWNDWADLTHGLVAAPAEIADRKALDAAAKGLEARRLRDVAREVPRDERAAARAAWRAELRAVREARASAGRWAGYADSVRPVSRWLAAGSRPLAAAPVLRHVPVLSIPLTGAGYAMDRQAGMAAGTAAAKNLASTAAGIGTATLIAGGTAAAAPVLLGIAAGAAVGYGVGKVVEHWGDDIVDGVGGAVSSAWGKVFG